ncbi:MAG: Transcriptional regulator [uncultured Rubrobacteraceae bacterium]|uniref:Transcriptional regulator n=1 Tax=uncultured Rubrobacteraceae bacterium TaxID=349277 RepID=A0A6J4PS85_9ACTN|nr:MAG: Transcriptional regulator [uncultured Rubrobacteraceae bacterium]
MNGGEYDNGQGAGQIGPILEKRRLEKGLSLKEVEQATKIRTRYLEGLEREDPTVLPDPVYARGFLKTYANFLGLDGESLSRELRDRRAPRRERQLSHEVPGTSDFDQPLITPGGVDGAERRRISGATVLTIALAVLVLAAVIGALYYVGSRSVGSGANDSEEPAVEREPDPAPSQKEEPAAEMTTGGGASDGAGKADDGDDAPETAPVTVRVAGAPAGLTISVDGAVALDQFAQPGFSQTFEAQNSVTVSTANAGAVEVEVDGQSVGRLGRYGQGATREFPVQPGG